MRVDPAEDHEVCVVVWVGVDVGVEGGFVEHFARVGGGGLGGDDEVGYEEGVV